MKLAWTVSTLIKNGYRIIKTRMTASVVETSKQAMPFGFDSNPSKNYVAIISETLSNEEPVIVGYLNPAALDSLNIGDSIHYSTNTEGEVQASIILRNDRTLEMLGTVDNLVRYSVLKEEYDKTKAVLDAILSTLQSPITEPGNGAPSAFQAAIISAVGTLETGDITESKIEEIKTI